VAGAAVGPYRILERLGAGGMGEVYLGHDPRLDRRVALKCLTSAEAATSEGHARILREGRAAARLTHPNIAGVYDVLEEGGRTYIVMEYVEGVSLSAYIAGGPRPPQEVCAIGRQIVSALAAAHAQGVIHRDLKPANIQVMRDGSVKVLDFGVARLAAPPANTRDATVKRQADDTVEGNPGTPIYMAPEQLGGQPADARSDIYSLGVVLFQMATGRRPYTETSAVPLALAMNAAPAPAARAVNPAVPAWLSDAIAAALERRPDDRFQSARELETALAEPSSATWSTARVAGSASSGGYWRTARRFSRLLVSIALAAVAVAVLARPALRDWLGMGAPPGPPPAIVIGLLPIETPGGEPQAEYLGAGIASVLARNFASVPRVTVLTRGATARYAGDREAFSAMQHALGVTHVLGVSLRTTNATLRLTSRVYRPGQAQPVWDETFSGDPLAVERDLLDGLGRMLERGQPRRRFSTDEWKRLRKLPTSSGAALVAHAEARALLDRTVPDYDRCLALLQQATTLDPQFALAWATLGDAWWSRYQLRKDAADVTKAADALRRAIAIDPESAPVYYSLGDMQYRRGQLGEAERSFRRAIQLQPDFDAAQRGLAQTLAGSGRLDEAEALLNEAIRGNPSYANYFMLGTIEYRAGRYAAAAAGFKRATEAAPDNAGAYTMLGNSQYILRDLQQAIGNFEHAVRLGPTAAAHANLALVYYDAGRYEDALRSYEQALERDPKSVANHRNIGDVYVRLGRTADARAAYERAVALGNELLAVNPSDVRTIGLVALSEAKLGRRSEAERHAAEAVAVDSSSREAWQRSAEVHALLKQPDAALRDLSIAVARGFDPQMARIDDDLASLRKLPRFEEILTSPIGNAQKAQGAR
jgi:serine/threonine-protein kinase